MIRLYTYFLKGVDDYAQVGYSYDGYNNYSWHDGRGNYDYSDYACPRERYQRGYVDEAGRYRRSDNQRINRHPSIETLDRKRAELALNERRRTKTANFDYDSPTEKVGCLHNRIL